MNDDDVYELTAHGASYRLWAWPGKVRSCMKAGRPYEAPLLEHVYEQGFHGTAIDAGANLGNHTMWFAAVCGMRVVAFEPLWHRHLINNVMLNPHVSERVRVEPVALGKRSGVAYHVGRGRLTSKPNNTPPLRVETLDSYELDDVHVMKLDVEGMEPNLLRGAADTIRRNRPVVFSEEWSDREKQAAADVLIPHDYVRVREFYGKNQTARVARWNPR